MKPVSDMSPGELAAFVCDHLTCRDIDVVLSGGGCVSIYSGGQYVSADLDFVNRFLVKRARIAQTLGEIGFHEEDQFFRHPDAKLLVEFPPGPLAIGDEPVRDIREVRFATGTLRALSPTDCVKDRLAWYYHSGDRQCLAQAALVAEVNDIDLDEVERWSRHEGKLDAFVEIRDRLRSGS